jgi:uncharacterized membrane protein HdeD (DUF308 family)
MKRKNGSELISSLLYIVVGILLIVFRSETLNWGMTIVGALFVISGVIDILRSNWAGGAVSLIIGIAILVLGWAATKIVLIVLGVLIALKGIVALINFLKAGGKNVLNIIFPVLSIVIGLMLAFGNGLDILIVITGALLTADGILGFIGSLLKK